MSSSRSSRRHSYDRGPLPSTHVGRCAFRRAERALASIHDSMVSCGMRSRLSHRAPFAWPGREPRAVAVAADGGCLQWGWMTAAYFVRDLARGGNKRLADIAIR